MKRFPFFEALNQRVRGSNTTCKTFALGPDAARIARLKVAREYVAECAGKGDPVCAALIEASKIASGHPLLVNKHLDLEHPARAAERLLDLCKRSNPAQSEKAFGLLLMAGLIDQKTAKSSALVQ